MTEAQELYPDHNPAQLDIDGNYYIRHVSAMTREGLHAKSDIAIQLGWRDREIDRLRAELAIAIAAMGPNGVPPLPETAQPVVHLQHPTSQGRDFKIYCDDAWHWAYENKTTSGIPGVFVNDEGSSKGHAELWWTRERELASCAKCLALVSPLPVEGIEEVGR